MERQQREWKNCSFGAKCWGQVVFVLPGKGSSLVLATAVQEQAGSSNCGTSQALGEGLCAGN